MAVTRINNNQISDAVSGNVYVGINAAAKLQNYSITSQKISNNLNYGSDLTVSGNLVVQGNVTAIDTIDLVVEDPLILLAKDQSGSPSLDIGFIGVRGSEENIAFVWNEANAEFSTVFTTSEITNTTVSISSYASLRINDLIASNANITGDIVFDGSIDGNISLTGNLVAGNVISNASVSAITISASGNMDANNISITNNIDTTTLNASANVTVNNLNANLAVTATDITASETVSANNISVTNNIDTTTIDASGNIVGANLNANTNITTVTLNASGNIDAANLNSNTNVTGVTFTASGNVDAANISAINTISSDNVIVTTATIGNANIANHLNVDTIDTTGNVLVGGNLIVQGNITYINIDDLRVEDPIIIMGTGPNGAPLSVDDGMDRGIYMEYYTTGLGNAWVGWQNSSGNLIAAADVTFSGNNVVSVNDYGVFQAGDGYFETILSDGNVTGANFNTAGEVVATGNITGGNVISDENVWALSGNVNAGNVNITEALNASTGFFTGNVDVLGNLNATVGIVYANSGIFYGDAVTGNNAAFAGVPGFTQLGSNVVMQFAGNVNSYSQLNFENINNGTLATTDIILTANNGNDTSYYLDLGMSGSNHDDPDFFGDVTGGTPNDAYLYVTASDQSGPSSNGGPGNLILGSTNGIVKTFVGNTAQANVITEVKSDGFSVYGNLLTTNSATIGNIIIDNNDITTNLTELVINEAGADINFRVEGDTQANLLVTDAGTDTVLINTGNAIANATLNVGGTAAIVVPIGTTGERPNPPTTGMVRFNTSINSLEFYDQEAWATAGSEFTIIAYDDFLGDGACTTFTLSQESTTAGAIVTINGIVQIPITAYSITNDSLVFTEAPSVSDFIDVRMLTTTNEVRSISNATGNAVVSVFDTSNDVVITGDLVPVSNVAQDLGSQSLQWRDLYLSGQSIFLGNVILKENAGNLRVRNFDDTADAVVEATFVATSISSGNLQFGGNHIEATNVNGNIELSPNGTGSIIFNKSVLNGQANGVGNIGSASSFFNTVFAKATSAQYADLAEMYEADQAIEPGTVVCFGGDKEITVCDVDMCTRVAGVISTNPSYLMNSTIEAEHAAAVALTGRVPVRVTGPVRKGDMMVSAGNGCARAESAPVIGSVIGKALENFSGTDGVIEVVVGRL